MISERLGRAIMTSLDLEEFPLEESTRVSEVPGWDSLTQLKVISSIEAEFGVRLKTSAVLRCRTLGELENLAEACGCEQDLGVDPEGDLAPVSTMDRVRHPIDLAARAYYRFVLPRWLRRKKGLLLEGHVHLIGHPVIEICEGAGITIADNVTLWSENNDYHINMHSPVKLKAARTGAEIIVGRNTRINGACISACMRVSIGANCLVAANSQLLDNGGHSLSFPDVASRLGTRGHPRPICIEDNVWIGANSIILPGVTVGHGSVVMAGSVVHKNVPAMVAVGGNPARVLADYT